MKHGRWLFAPAAVLAISACGAQGATQSSPKTPIQMEKRSDASDVEERAKERERTPHHVAPPPAYGNKVVLAVPACLLEHG